MQGITKYNIMVLLGMKLCYRECDCKVTDLIMPQSAGKTAKSDSRANENFRMNNGDLWSGFIGAFPTNERATRR